MIDVERNVLGACFLSQDAYWRVADLLVSDDFSSPDYALCWDEISRRAKSKLPGDAVTVVDEVPGLGILPVELANDCVGAANIRAHAERIAKNAEKRRFARLRERLAKAESPEAAYALLATIRPKEAFNVKPAREFFRSSLDQLNERLGRGKAVTGLPSGLAPLDEMTSGWQPGNLIVLGARPSVGKTAIALQFSLHASVVEKSPVLFFSQEQSGVELTDRAASHLGRVPGESIRDPRKMEDEHWTRITSAASKIVDCPLLIDESSRQSIESVTAKCRQKHAEQKLGLVVIDYLGLMSMPKADRHDLAVGAVTGALKALAKDLKVPILLLCQLNREGVGRPGDKDLRDSGAIEQDADLILLMYRRDVERRDHTTLILHKQRNGPTGDIELHSQLSLMRFDPWTGAIPFEQTRTRGYQRAA